MTDALLASEAEHLAVELLRVIAQLESSQPLTGAQEAGLGEARGLAEWLLVQARAALT